MDADPRDDFSGFAGLEHMFYGLSEPYREIRRHLEDGLREQVPDTLVDAISMEGAPKFLTLGRKTEDPSKIIVAHHAFCLRARVSLRYDGGRKHETMAAALTFLFGNVDRPDQVLMRTHFDLHDDATRGFDEDFFEKRFLEFRATLP